MRNRWMAICLLAGLVAGATAVYATDFAVIVHPGNATKAMSLADLDKIFRGKTATWPNGRPVTVVLRDPDSPAMKFIIEKVIGDIGGRRQSCVERGEPRQNRSIDSFSFRAMRTW